MVGEDVEVKVVQVRGKKVRIGIVAVHPKEVFDAFARCRDVQQQK